MVTAPAVRVGVLEVVAAHECATLLEQVDDDGVRLEDEEAVEGKARVVLQLAVGVDVAGERKVVLDAGGEVVGAVRGRGVDGAGALLGGDVVGKDTKD